MFIDTLFKFIDFMRPEGQSGFITPERKQEALNYAQFEKFNKEKVLYGLDQDVTDRLRRFERRSELTAQSSTIFAVPDNYGRAVSFAHKQEDGAEVSGKIIPHGRWADAKRSRIKRPTLEYPVMVIRNTIEVAPVGVVPVLYYLKMPDKVVYNYTVIDDVTIQFSQSGSTDIEWPEAEHPEILSKTLQYLGVPLKDDWLLQFERFKAEQRDAGL